MNLTLRNVKAERDAALAQKRFDARATSVKTLEFWKVGVAKEPVRISASAVAESAATCKEVVLANLDKVPTEDWLWAVAVHDDGSRSQVTLMEAQEPGKFEKLPEALHEANTYVAPNFNIDTSTNVAGLTALKGSAPATTDVVWHYNGATVTLESSCSLLRTRAGETSGGAAGAGNRYGHLTISAGVTVTWGGAASSYNSGPYSIPVSADASSKSSDFSQNGTEASPVVMTNAGGAFSASQRYSIFWRYGTITTWGSITFQYPGNTDAYGTVHYPHTATYTTQTTLNFAGITRFTLGAQISYTYAFIPGNTEKPTLPINIGPVIIDATAIAGQVSYSVLGNYTGGYIAQDTAVSVKSVKFSGNSATNCFSFFPIACAAFSVGATRYINALRVSNSDIRPTEVVPADLAAADATTGKTLTITWSNGASYAAGDKLVVYNASGDAVLGYLDATAGTGQICGLTDGTAYTVYAKATSDNFIYSAASANAGAATPTHSGYDFPATTSVAADDSTDGATGAIALNQILAPRGTAAAAATYYTYTSGAPVLQSIEPVALGATETTIYTCPADTRAVVRLTLTNTDSTARTATVHKVLSGETAADANAIKKSIPLAIAGNDGDDWVDCVRTLEEGDKISGLASSASVVIANIEVIEVPVTIT